MKDGEEHYYGRVSLKAVIVSDNGVLIQRNVSDGEYWDLPGGVLNAGEKPADGLIREVKEELAVDIRLLRPLATNSFIKKDRPTILVVYEAHLVDPTQPIIPEEGEVSEFRWIKKDDLLQVTLYPEYHTVVEDFFTTV